MILCLPMTRQREMWLKKARVDLTTPEGQALVKEIEARFNPEPKKEEKPPLSIKWSMTRKEEKDEAG